MKSTILFTLSIGMSALANAAGINASNVFNGPGDTIITDNAGRPISNDALFGSLVTFAEAPTDIASLQAATPAAVYVPAGNLDGTTGDEGVINLAYNGPGGTGEAIYLILSNSSDFRTASNVGLIDTGLTLDADGAAPDANNYTLASGNGTALVGSFLADTVTANWTTAVGENNTGPQFQLVAVPEPSTSLLAALAGLGLIARRRR